MTDIVLKRLARLSVVEGRYDIAVLPVLLNNCESVGASWESYSPPFADALEITRYSFDDMTQMTTLQGDLIMGVLAAATSAKSNLDVVRSVLGDRNKCPVS